MLREWDGGMREGMRAHMLPADVLVKTLKFLPLICPFLTNHHGFDLMSPFCLICSRLAQSFRAGGWQRGEKGWKKKVPPSAE